MTVLTRPRMQNVNFRLTCVAHLQLFALWNRGVELFFFFLDLSLENNGSVEKQVDKITLLRMTEGFVALIGRELWLLKVQRTLN